MSSLGISVGIEVSNISSSLNSIILLVFLAGMYTIIYFGTIYVYFTRKPSKYHPVPIIMTILYLSGMGGTALQWYATKWQFIDNGDTRDSVFLVVLNSPQWLSIGLDSFYCVTYVISDGLLIWRCFHIWNCSWRIIAAPLFLLVTELALFLVEISFEAKYSSSNMPTALAATLNVVLAAVFFISAGTTLTTTLLIAYKICSVARKAGTSGRPFKHIVDIVFQSGAVYALSQFTAALGYVVPGSTTFNKSIVAFQDYGQVLNFSIAGMSATVMVARVALYSSSMRDTVGPSTSEFSGLQFRARSTHQTVNLQAMGTIHSDNSDTTSSSEGKAVEEKV